MLTLLLRDLDNAEDALSIFYGWIFEDKYPPGVDKNTIEKYIKDRAYPIIDRYRKEKGEDSCVD